MSRDTLEQYRAFVARTLPNDDGYLFDTPRCRFWPEASDDLVVPPGARAVRTSDGVAIELAGGARLAVSGVNFGTLERALSLFPCSYARLTAELGPAVQAFVEQTFSRVLFAPTAVAELELEQPACEIVRFPGSPYEVVRSYWRNLCAVRRRLELLEGPPPSTQAFRALVQDLHRVLLLGDAGPDGRQSFYLPASALARKRLTPGEFYEAEARLEHRGAEVIMTSGARVSVPLLGGTSYWQLLAESVSDNGALDHDREVRLDGLDWGRVVHGRAEEELQARPWFLPPRPLKVEHFAALLADLRGAFEARARGDVSSALSSLAAFHYRFVRAHPLPSANQSLSMCFVNLLLRGVLGIGVPHLLLDQLALRFELGAYQRLFARAARAWCAPWPSATDRLRSLLRMRAELNDFVSQLGAAGSLVEARALLADGDDANQYSHGARLALLCEPGDVRLGIG